MKRIRQLIWLIFFGFLVMVNGTTYASNNFDWKVDKIGTFSVPQHWQAVDMIQVLETIMKESTLKSNKPPANIPLPKIDPFAMWKTANLQMYQVTMNDDNAYHTAFIAFFKDAKPMKLDERKYFTHKLSPEEQEQLEIKIKSAYQEIEIAAKHTLDPKLSKTGVNFIQLSPVDYLKVKDRQAYGVGARFLVSAYELTMPYYIKGYVFDDDGSIAIAFLLTADSERLYWDPIVRKVIRSFEPIDKPLV